MEAPEEQFFGEQSGTKIVLHLREEAQDSWELHRSEGKCVMAMFFPAPNDPSPKTGFQVF